MTAVLEDGRGNVKEIVSAAPGRMLYGSEGAALAGAIGAAFSGISQTSLVASENGAVPEFRIETLTRIVALSAEVTVSSRDTSACWLDEPG